MSRGVRAINGLHLCRRLSQVSILASRGRSIAASIDSSHLESVGLGLTKASHSLGVVFSLDDLGEEASRVTIIPEKFVVSDGISTSLSNAEHSLPADLESSFVSSLFNFRIFHLGGHLEDKNASGRGIDLGPITSSNRVRDSHSSIDESFQGD